VLLLVLLLLLLLLRSRLHRLLCCGGAAAVEHFSERLLRWRPRQARMFGPPRSQRMHLLEGRAQAVAYYGTEARLDAHVIVMGHGRSFVELNKTSMLLGTMRTRSFYALALMGLAACAPKARHGTHSATQAPTVQHLVPEAYLSVALPADWEKRTHLAADIFHGPKGTDAYYATLTVQRRPLVDAGRLDEAVAHALAAVAHRAGFVWDALELGWAGEDLALGYRVRFNALETTHCQNGWVFVHGETLVGMTLSAPEAIYPAVVPVFQGALDSLAVFSFPPLAQGATGRVPQ
jgi:hypothetical protein